MLGIHGNWEVPTAAHGSSRNHGRSSDGTLTMMMATIVALSAAACTDPDKLRRLGFTLQGLGHSGDLKYGSL